MLAGVLVAALAAGHWVGSAWLTPQTGSTPSPAAELVAEERTTLAAVPVLVEPVLVTNAEPRSRNASARELAMAQLEVARELLARRQLEESLEAYRTAVALYPSPETHAALGGLYFKLAVGSKAYVQFRKAVELDPYSADLWLDLASAEHLRGAIGESWYAVKRAREVEPGIQIDRDKNGFYRRATNDSKFHVSKGSYLGRGTP